MLLTFNISADGLLVVSADDKKMVVGPKTSLFRRSMGPDKSVLCLTDKKMSMTIEGGEIDVASYNAVADREYLRSLSLEDAMGLLLAKWAKSEPASVDAGTVSSAVSSTQEQSTSFAGTSATPKQQTFPSLDDSTSLLRKRSRTDGSPVRVVWARALELADEVVAEMEVEGGAVADDRLLNLLRQQTPFSASSVAGLTRTELAHRLLRLLENAQITVVVGQPVIFRR